MNRKLLIIYAVLIAIVAVEGFVYLFFYSPYKKIITEVITKPPQKLLNQRQYFVGPDNSRIDIDNKLVNPRQAINQDTLSDWYTMLRWFKVGVMTRSVWQNEFEGEVSEIDTDGGLVAGQPYSTSITLDSQDKQQNTFYFNETILTLPTTKIVQLKNGVESPIPIQEIRVDDRLRIYITINMKEEFLSSQIEYKIIKL